MALKITNIAWAQTITFLEALSGYGHLPALPAVLVISSAGSSIFLPGAKYKINTRPFVMLKIILMYQ
jgi:hypothetical protein